MKIEFSNLGTIKHTELDLRPLTVIIGPNNSNKTYIAYSIYGLWKAVGSTSPSLEPVPPLSLVPHNRFYTIENGSYIFNLSSPLLSILERTYQEGFEEFTSNLEIYFQDTSRVLFQKTRFNVNLTAHDYRTALNNLSGLPIITQNKSFTMMTQDDNLVVRPKAEDQRLPANDPFLAIWDEVILSMDILRGLLLQIFPAPFLLPAERNALVITYKMLANRRYKMLRDKQRTLFDADRNQQRQFELLREQGDLRYPEPIEDFLDALTDIEIGDNLTLDSGGFQSDNSSRNGRSKNMFGEIASLVEQHIQGGNKTQFRGTRLGGKEIVVNVNKDLRIDLYNASSSIKQLAPLLLYLRYRARKNDLLIIDEPEMNLHPESQVKLLEILAILVNAGVNVLLTTHSPYFLAHLNNLAQSEDKSAAVRKRQATSLYLNDPRAFLSMEQVSAYEMKDNERGENELKTLKDPDYGIRWDTLSDVSVDVQQKYFEIYEKGKVSSRAKTRRPAQTAQGEKG
jgi:AAA15 family ATPase/GTPase